MIVANDTHHYERCVLNYIHNKTNIGQIRSSEELSIRLLHYPFAYPCLVEFYSTINREGEYVSAIECNKKTAKSIVYPHTNICNSNKWSKMSCLNEYDELVEYLMARQRCSAVSHVNRYEIQLALDKNEHFLISYAICHEGKALKMFLLKKEEAKKLVYYKKEREELKKKNTETWKKNLTKKAKVSNLERLVRTYTTYRREDDIQFYNPEN